MTECKMITCAACKHSWDTKAGGGQVCPACGQSADCSQTVDSDAGVVADHRVSQTVDSDTADVIDNRLGATVDGDSVVAVGDQVKGDLASRDPESPDSIATTIQVGRWAPSTDELRNIAATVPPELLQRLTTTGIFAGVVSEDDSNDSQSDPQLTGTVDLSIEPASESPSTKGSQNKSNVIDVSSDRDTSLEGLGATVDGLPSDDLFTVSPGLGATIGGLSGTVDETNEHSAGLVRAKTIESRSGHTIIGSKAGRPTALDSVASSAAAAASNNELEKTLVIQQRILRPEPFEQTAETLSVDRSDYDLLKKLGEGGMGVVFSARQQSIRRVVALKMLKARSTHEVKQREKFLAEAVITGDLEHPNIVPIYDLGRDEEGAIFYAMKCVNGTPWDKLIHEKSQQENLEILMKVADAVAFAHSKNVIHRDLKPENVMLGDFGEVLVMDWGLAISTVAYTRFALGGTPAYMAPEMVLGPAEAIGAHSDIYLLGAILYEFVTGHRPHKGESITLCLMAASKNEIIPTEKTGELVQIALKAMANDPRQRYSSVRAMQDAIREYLSHTESIALAARAQSDLAEAVKTNRYDSYARALFGFQEAIALWDGNLPAKLGATKAAFAYAECARERGDYELGLSLLDPSLADHQPLISQLQTLQTERDQRNQRLKAARRAGMALVAIIFAIVTTSFFWIRMEAERARKAEVVANSQRADALFQKGVADEQRADALLQKRIADEQRAAALSQKMIADEQRAVAIAARQDEERERMVADAARVAEKAARELADTKREEAEMARANEQVQRAVAEEAQRREQYEGYIAKIGLAAAKIEENAYDRSLGLLDECPPELRHWEWGRLKYLCSREVMKFDGGVPLEAMALSLDGEYFAVGGWGPDVLVFAFNNGEPIARIKTGATQVFSLAFSPSGDQLAIGSNEKPHYASIWDIASGDKSVGLEGHKDAVLSVAWSNDGKKLLTGSYDHSARLWDINDGSSKQYLGHDWWVWSANFSPDEQRIVTASQDGSAIVWDVQSDVPGPAFTAHESPVLTARFSPDGETIASGGYDGRVMRWNPASLKGQDLAEALVDSAQRPVPTGLTSITAHNDAVRSIDFSSDGKRLLTSGNDNVVRLWGLDDWAMQKEFRGHASRVAVAQFMRDEDYVVSAAYDESVKVWNIPKHREQDVLGGSVLQGHLDSILGAAFDPTGKLVVTASRDRSAISWDLATGQQIQTFHEGHAYLASNAFFVPGGRQVLTVAIDNTARIWDTLTGTQVAVVDGTGIQAAAAVSADGQWFATGSDRKSIVIWNLAGERLREFDGLESDVTALAISPDGRYLVAGDTVGRCRMIDSQLGQSVWESRTHSRGITRIAFVPGTDKLMTASLDQVVSIRDSRTGAEDATRLLKHSGPVTSMAVSNDGTRAITSCSDNKIRIWRLGDSKLMQVIDGGDIACSGVAISPDAKIAGAIMADRKIRLWDLQSNEEIGSPGSREVPFMNLSQTTIPIWSVTFSENGENLLTVGGTEARIWEVKTGKTLQIFLPQSAVASIHFSPSGDRLVTGSWDNAARIWDTDAGIALIKLRGGHTRFVNSSVFSPDGQFVLTASDDRTAVLWNSETGQLVGRYSGHEGRVTDAVFSPDGLRVLTASDDHTVRIWDTKTFQSLAVLEGHTQAVLCAKYSPDGKLIATGSDDTTARLWSAQNGEPLGMVLDGHTASVAAVAFSPDSRRVFTGSKDTSAKLWDPETGKEILTLSGHTQEITTVAVSPSGDMVLTASRDGTAILWPSVSWNGHDGQAAHLAIKRFPK